MALSPLQQKLFDVLADGKAHSKEELLAVIDSLADDNCLRVLLHKVRRALPEGVYLHADLKSSTYRLLCPYTPAKGIISNGEAVPTVPSPPPDR